MLNFKNVSINDTKDLVYIYNVQKGAYLIKNGADFVSIGTNKENGKHYMTFLKTTATGRATSKYKEEYEKKHSELFNDNNLNIIEF